jgi:hypothetical protein
MAWFRYASDAQWSSVSMSTHPFGFTLSSGEPLPGQILVAVDFSSITGIDAIGDPAEGAQEIEIRSQGRDSIHLWLSEPELDGLLDAVQTAAATPAPTAPSETVGSQVGTYAADPLFQPPAATRRGLKKVNRPLTVLGVAALVLLLAAGAYFFLFMSGGSAEQRAGSQFIEGVTVDGEQVLGGEDSAYSDTKAVGRAVLRYCDFKSKGSSQAADSFLDDLKSIARSGLDPNAEELDANQQLSGLGVDLLSDRLLSSANRVCADQ